MFTLLISLRFQIWIDNEFNISKRFQISITNVFLRVFSTWCFLLTRFLPYHFTARAEQQISSGADVCEKLISKLQASNVAKHICVICQQGRGYNHVSYLVNQRKQKYVCFKYQLLSTYE